MTRETVLFATIVELTDTLVEEFDVVDLLTMLVDRCVDVFDVTAAGIMIAAPGGQLRPVAASDAGMRSLELFELQTDEGPCLDCFRSGNVEVSEDLGADAEARWPRFAPAAVAAGYHSAQAVPMRLRSETIGALNLFRAAVGALSTEDSRAAQAFADIATISILQHRAVSASHLMNEQLTVALKSRVIIEQAKGFIAERTGLSVEQAFGRLRSHARSNNLLLTDVAADVVNGRASWFEGPAAPHG